MHLTNYSINKHAEENGTAEQPVPKWPLSEFWDYLDRQGYDSNELKEDVKKLVLSRYVIVI
jgi:hypothetical protein